MTRICKDHKGNIYKSMTQMCRAYGVHKNTYRARIARGWTQEEALTGRFKGKRTSARAIPCHDHLGNEYPSLLVMCEAYGISIQVYRYRKKQGWPLKKILCASKVVGVNRPSEDHLGNWFPSQAAMCEHYGTTSSVYTNRIKRGWTKEEALCATRDGRKIPCTDHLGNAFPSKKELYEHYEVSPSAVFYRCKNGITLKDALLQDPISATYVCDDHLGNQFANEQQMCDHYKVKKVTYRARLRYGFTKEEALTSKNMVNIPSEDGFGNTFPSRRQMCLFYDINPSVFRNDLLNGLTPREIILKRSSKMAPISK